MLKKLLFVLTILPSFVFAQTNLSQGGTGWTSSTVGQLLVGTSSTLRYSRFNPGTAGSILQASSTSPFRMAWVTLASIFDSLLSSNNTWTGTNNFTATTTLDKVVAGTSAGLQFFSNGLTQVADFGAGGGSNASFYGGVNVTGNLAVDTNVLYVDTTNNRVGIGTTNPNYKLEVVGTSYFNGTANFGGTYTNFGGGYGATGTSIDANGNISADGNLVLGGNIGIGTSTPEALLTVYSTSTSGTSPVFMVATTTPIIRAQANGRVGIGSNVGTPSAPLHIFTPVANSTTVTGQYIINAGSGAAAGAELLLGYAATTAGSGGIASFYDTSHFNGTVGVKTRLSAGGTTFLTGSVTGDVGVGSTTPSARFVVQGQSGSTTPILLVASSTGSTPYFNITAAGNVGIGTAAPQGVLHVKAGGSDSLLTGAILANESTGATAGTALDFRNHTTNTVNTARIIAQRTTAANSNSNLQFWNFFGGSLQEAMRINESGNVGIGTTSPTADLHIESSSAGDLFKVARTSGAIGSFYFNDTSDRPKIVITRGAGTQEFAMGISGTSFSIADGTDVNANQRLTIDSTGRVGIGTTTPTSILSVATSSTSGSVDMFRVSSGISQTIMNILSSGATLFGTSTQATCGSTTCGVTIATTTQVTQGSFAVPEYRWGTGTSTSMTIDWTRANTQNIILGTSAVTITFTNATTTTGQVQKLVICNPAGGSGGAITWGTAITWSAGTAPTQTTTANKCDVWSFISTNATGTARIFGSQSSNF